jgi:hypothetical protein
MPALVAGAHVLNFVRRIKDVDGRDKPGHDVERASIIPRFGIKLPEVPFALVPGERKRTAD